MQEPFYGEKPGWLAKLWALSSVAFAIFTCCSFSLFSNFLTSQEGTNVLGTRKRRTVTPVTLECKQCFMQKEKSAWNLRIKTSSSLPKINIKKEEPLKYILVRNLARFLISNSYGGKVVSPGGELISSINFSTRSKHLLPHKARPRFARSKEKSFNRHWREIHLYIKHSVAF